MAKGAGDWQEAVRKAREYEETMKGAQWLRRRLAELLWNKAFAKYAWYAQDWGTLNGQLPKIRKPDPAFFGGPEQFNRMLTEAKAHAKP